MPQLVQLAQQNPDAAQKIWADFAARDPAKAARIAQLDAGLRADAAQAQLAAVHQHQNQQHAFREYAKAEDAKFKAAHPEAFADRRAQFELQADAVEVLKAKGLSEDRLRQLWTTSPEFRSAEGQALVYAAVKNYRAEKAMREARPVAAPPPVRPGNRNTATGRFEPAPDLRSIDRAGTQRQQITAAKNILLEQRRLAAERSATMTLFDTNHANLLDTIGQGVAAVRAERNAAERKLVADECVKAIDGPFADQLLAAYKRLTPSEEVRKRHCQKFRDFQAFANGAGAQVMPAHGAVVGCYLLDLLMDHKPLVELRAAADAIQFIHHEKGHHVDEAYISAALDVAAEIANGPGDDGGGEPVTNDPPPPAGHEPMPLAAQGA